MLLPVASQVGSLAVKGSRHFAKLLFQPPLSPPFPVAPVQPKRQPLLRHLSTTPYANISINMVSLQRALTCIYYSALSQPLCSTRAAFMSTQSDGNATLHLLITSGEEGGAEAKSKRRDADFHISRISGSGQVGCITTVLFRR